MEGDGEGDTLMDGALRPQSTVRGQGECRKLPRWFMGRNLSRNTLGAFNLKIWLRTFSRNQLCSKSGTALHTPKAVRTTRKVSAEYRLGCGVSDGASEEKCTKCNVG